ncbi:hypothetical protein JNW90_08980 [Micromonospora sp. STR1s_5]|nr:hypothetical protein [Micromonospora sp. STR1s_5]
MQASRKVKPLKPKVLFKGDDFDALVGPLGLLKQEEQAADLGIDPGNYSRIRRGQAVSSEFIARVLLKYPKVPYERLFHQELS